MEVYLYSVNNIFIMQTRLSTNGMITPVKIRNEKNIAVGDDEISFIKSDVGFFTGIINILIREDEMLMAINVIRSLKQDYLEEKL